MTTKRTTTKATKATRTKKTPAKRRQKPKVAGKAAKPATRRPTKTRARDPRIPAVGSVIGRTFKGKQIEVKVLADGFEYNGERFTSISAVARRIVGYMISGPVFFRLGEPKRAEAN